MKRFKKLLGRYQVTGHPLQTERRVEFGFLIAATITLLVFLYGGLRLLGIGPPAPLVPGSETLAVAEAGVLQVVTDELSREVGARPLFWRSRRPEVPIPEEVPQESSEDEAGNFEDVKLMGVFGSGDSVGIIALVAGEKQRILRGQELKGWKLASVKEGKARFRSGPGRQELELKHANIPPKAEGENHDTTDESQRLMSAPMPGRPQTSEPSAVPKKGPKSKRGNKDEPSDALTVGGAPVAESDFVRAMNQMNTSSNSSAKDKSGDQN